MLCYAMVWYVMLCYVVLRYVMLCYVMLRYVMLCCVMLCYVKNWLVPQQVPWTEACFARQRQANQILKNTISPDYKTQFPHIKKTQYVHVKTGWFPRNWLVPHMKQRS